MLEPGAWSSQRHWHEGIDEFVVMLDGEAVLVEDDGETILRPGDCAVFPKDVPNGHHLVNRSDRPCTFLAIDCQYGEGDCHYPDIDLHWDMAAERYHAQGRQRPTRRGAVSYSSITQGSSCASSIHSTTSARWRTASI